MKNTAVGMNNNLDAAKEKTSEFEDTAIETVQNETPREKSCHFFDKKTINN